MSNDLARVAKRIARQMADLMKSDPLTKNSDQLSVFIGMGICLGMVFEQATGQDPARRLPQEIIRWAAGLPLESDEKRIVLPN
jgi:hypothetical protein